MSAESDPFGFEQPKPGFSPRPMVVVALPGQEVHIVVADSLGVIPAIYGDSASPKGSGDSSGASPKGSGDSGGASPKGSGDAREGDPFGFGAGPQPGYSPRAFTIVARAGQEVRVVVPDHTGAVPGILQDSAGASPKGSGDGTG